MIRVRVLGAVEVSIGHRKIGMNTEILFACAVYLTARAGERIPREDLLTFFWSKGTVAERRHALRQLLYRLRQKGAELDEDGEWVRLDTALSDSDLRHALDASWIEKATAAEIDAAGNFLPVFSRRMAPGFVTWLDGVREQLSAQHRKAAQRQITQARREGRWSDLERWALAVLKSDPLNEEATMARAESAAMGGSKVIAMEILDTYLSEVGDISPELGRPALALRKRLAERRPDWGFRGPKEVALVGRTDLMSRLTGLVEAAWRGEGSAVVLVGAPGIGKTRLALETRAYAELKGMRTVVVRAEAGMIERPLSLLIELARLLVELEGAVACDPDSLRLIRKLLADRDRPMAQPEGSLIRPVSEYFAKSLVALLDACQHERRLLLVVDDLHNADAPSLTAFASLMRQASRRRIAWIATSRTRARIFESDHNELPSAATLLRVRPLDRDASEALADSTANAHSLSISPGQRAMLIDASGGNPLFLRELSLARATQPSASRLPDSLQGVISERLGRLTPDKVRLLRLIALLGGEATPSRLARLSASRGAELSAAIESLEEDGLISASLEGALQLHECWQIAVAEQLTSATATSLAYECASLLLTELQDGSNPRTVWRTAELLKLAGDAAHALTLFLSAAERLYSAGLPGEAAIVFERAMPLADRGMRNRILVRLATAHLASGHPRHCIEAVDELRSSVVAGTAEEREHFARASALRAEASAKLCDPHEDDLNRIVEIVQDSTIAVDVRLSVGLTGARLSANGHYAEIERLVFSLVSNLAGHSPQSIEGVLAQIIFRTEHGPVSQLRELHRRLFELDAAGSHPALRSASHRVLAHSLRLMGDTAAAILSATQAFTIAKSTSLPDDAALSAELLAYILLDQNENDQAENWLGEAASILARPGYAQRSIAIRHADERLLLQRERYDEVVERVSSREALIRADPVALSRLTELATFALALAKTGQHERARGILAEIALGLGPMVGLSAGDYTTEICSKTLTEIGDSDQAIVLADAHIRQRESRFIRPLAPFFAELRQSADRLRAS